MKTMTARYSSTCAGCGTAIRPGQTMTGTRGRWYHGAGSGQGCAPSGDRRADAEYHRGVREVETWKENRRMFGDEVADVMEIERELREGWDY